MLTRRNWPMGLCILATVAALACHDLTEPIHGLFSPAVRRDLNGAGAVVVYPGNMHGWVFMDRAARGVCTSTTACAMVSGPTGQPLGSGSAELAAATNDGVQLQLGDYHGVVLSRLTQLEYYSFTKTHGSTPGTIRLSIDVDFDLTDTDTTAYALSFEPPGDTSVHSWQHFDARSGAYWYSTATTVIRAGASVANPCVAATPCTFAQVIDHFPNAGVHATRGLVYLRASGWGFAGFRGDVDAFSIGIGGSTTTFDFDPAAPVPLIPPDSTPSTLLAQLGNVSGAPLSDSAYRKNIVVVEFTATATQTQRQAAVDSVGGTVVGGHRFREDTTSGRYYVLITGGTTSALVNAATILRRQPGVTFAGWPVYDPAVPSYRKPTDGAGWNNWLIDPSSPVSTPVDRDSASDNRRHGRREAASVANPCIATTPCTVTQVIERFPNVGVHATRGQVYLRASGWGFAGFRGDADAFSIGIDGATTTFDFELAGPVPASAPDSLPRALFDSLGMINGAPLSPSESYRKRIVLVAFRTGTAQPQRQAVIDAIGGTVVGGKAGLFGTEGTYYVLIQGETTRDLVTAVSTLQRQSAVSFAAWWQISDTKPRMFRRPIDGGGWSQH